MNSWDSPTDSDFDEDFARGFIGKYLLVGVTRTTNDGEIISQEQLHGTIAAVTANGVDLELQGVNKGKTWRMAPFLNELSPAPPGKYNLRSTGEVVEDPDFTFSVTIINPVRQ